MPAWVWIVAGTGVAWVLFVWAFRPWHKAAHATPRGTVSAPEPPTVGSMILAEEQAHAGYGWVPDGRLAAWAGGSDVQPDPYLDPIAAEHVSEYDPTAGDFYEEDDPAEDIQRAWDSGEPVLVIPAPAHDTHWLRPWTPADVAAELRRQDADARAFMLVLADECRTYVLGMAAAL